MITLRPQARLVSLLVLVLVTLFFVVPQAAGQVPVPGTAPTADAEPMVPDDLTPEMVDSLMARMSDEDIRNLLREELRQRAEERAAAEAEEFDAVEAALTRLATLRDNLEVRGARWITALGSLEERAPQISARLALAEGGVGRMLLAALFVVMAGVAAAVVLGRVLQPWRHWLMRPQEARYWDRVVRSLALLVLELLPVIAFVAATVILAPQVAGWLGPLVDYVWIYHTGVSYGWAFIVVARRVYAPDASAIRTAAIGDVEALALHRLVRRAALIATAGWLLAGLSPTLGLGFPPAIITVGLAGTAVAFLLIFAALRGRQAIARDVSAFLHPEPRTPLLVEQETGQEAERPAAGARLLAMTAPFALIGYLLVAWLYWLAHWLESGQQRLEGPVNTLLILLVLPILDKAGAEVIDSVLRSRSPASERFRAVFRGAWRTVLGLVAVFLAAGFWGLDLLNLVKGPQAPMWAGTAFDVVLTLLIGQLIWRLIRAALYREAASGAHDDEEEPGEVAPSSRLDTLLPLFRNLLLGILAIIMIMIVLSSLGVDIGPLLASAGIIGIAIGFGAQTLVRDIFSGAFFLIDDAFRVGEYIELDGDLRGEVEAISVRSLQLRHHRGPVITIPFGELKSVTNHNRDWVIYKMNFRMEPDTDPQVVKKIVKEVGKELWNHPEHGPKFIEPLKSQGVYMIDEDSALVIRVKFMCKPRAQFVLRREVYHRLREVFNERGVRLARRKVEVVSGDGDGSADDLVQRGALPDEVLAGPKSGA
ncbi:MAG: mechanosensitive ion channel family protein [Pseudomonadota bacterium]